MAEYTLSSFSEVHAALCNPALRQSLYDAGEVIMKDVLLTLHGEPHKTRRHLELRLFRRNFAHHYEQVVFPATLAQVLEPAVDRGQVDLVDFGYRVTMNLTADFAGIDRPAGSPEETEALLGIVKSFSEGATLVHSDRDRETVISEVLAAREAFQAFLSPSWQRRAALVSGFNQGKIMEDELPRDILTVLLRNQDNVDLPDDMIEREIGFYLQAGSHSTANSMVHAVHELFAWTPDPETLLDDPLLLQRCIHESMRLHPASPVAWRTPTKSMQLGGKEVTPDDLLVLDLEAANRDVTVFGQDADRFNPHRSVMHPKTEAYGLTFGTGVHMCTGRDLDGGVAAKPGSDPATHQYGIVCKLIEALLRQGMKPHRTESPSRDRTTTRNNWGYYPIEFREDNG